MSQGWNPDEIDRSMFDVLVHRLPITEIIRTNEIDVGVASIDLAGAELALNYRLYWVADEPFPHKLGRVVATRLGRGGQPGQPRPKGVRTFFVEFLGGPLTDLPYGVIPERIVSASRGSLKGYHLVEAAPDGVPGHWRAEFDLTVDGTDPVELRGYLQSGGKTLTEVWMFQYHPF